MTIKQKCVLLMYDILTDEHAKVMEFESMAECKRYMEFHKLEKGCKHLRFVIVRL